MRTGRQNRPAMFWLISRVGSARQIALQFDFSNGKQSMSTLTCEVSQGAPPVCLFAENPYRLVTLWDMLRVFADVFVKLIEALKQAELETSGIIQSTLSEERYTGRLLAIGHTLNGIREHCEYLRLRSAEKQCSSIVEWLSTSPTDLKSEFWRMLQELRRRVQEDLEDVVMYSVEPSRVDSFYFREAIGPLKGKLLRLSPEAQWGNDTCSNFKSAITDIKDASKCLTFDQGTACVFHLMRVMEVGLRALGKSLNDPRLDPKTNPSWENILKRCDDELKQPYNKRSPEWQTDPEFFNEATANLRAVKDAWRNPTMHVEKDYDYDEAFHVWTTARSFMRHLATKLHE
jgi:hypothetical protein